MKPEELKVIAEGMGRFAETRGNANIVYIYGANQDPDTTPQLKYNPLTNNDQMVEILDVLLSNDFIISKDLDTGNYEVWQDSYSVSLVETYLGKTINEAVCKAAYEYFKDK